MQKPYQFTDIMVKGTFKSLKHQHFFKEQKGCTLMTDRFEFESPFGIIGKLFNKFFLKKYLQNFLLERNAIIKKTAES